MKTILVPTDFSTYGSNAARTAASLAEKTHANILLQHNIPTLLQWSSMSVDDHHKYPDIVQRSVTSENKLNDLMGNYTLRHLNVSKVVTKGVTHEKIVQQAQSKDADIIVIGSHGNDLNDKFFIGSNVQKIMREAPCPVMTVNRELYCPTWKIAVVPVSLDDNISKPFEKIKEIALELGSVVHLLYVNTPDHFKNEQKIRAGFQSIIENNLELKFETAVYCHREIDTGIIEYCNKVKADWIGMVSHDRKHKDKYLMGVTETIAFKSDIPLVRVLLN